MFCREIERGKWERYEKDAKSRDYRDT